MDAKQSKGLKRNTIDKYYTKGIVVEQCLNILHLWTFKMPILVFIIFVFSYLIFLNIIFLSIICSI
jgi:hypothetical protein